MNIQIYTNHMYISPLHCRPPRLNHPPTYIVNCSVCRIYRYISDRNTHVKSFKSKLDELNEISSLGGGVHGTTTRTVVVGGYPKPVPGATTIVHVPVAPQRPPPNLDPYAKAPANR